jgi:hypothetical protein
LRRRDMSPSTGLLEASIVGKMRDEDFPNRAPEFGVLP